MSVKRVRNAIIYTPEDGGAPLSGHTQGSVRIFSPGAMTWSDGRIVSIGPEEDVLGKFDDPVPDMDIDAQGRCLIPGFIDPHTHMCFAKTREDEFSLRIKGTSYLEILRRGGGILSSVRAVRAASEEDLFNGTLKQVLSALGFGTTTVEIKSGYGLDTQTELKMLRVIRRIALETPLDVVPTFLGAHAIPETYRDHPDAFVDVIIKEMLPAVADQGIARFCDVFCEEGVFSITQSHRILAAAKNMGFGLKLHADEVNDLGGAGLAAGLKAISADHLLAASDENLSAMADAGVISVLLPATAYSLRKPYARARRMIELDVPLALATDCNPGSSYCESMPFAFGLAVMHMGLTPEEALVAATLNGAHAIGFSAMVGSLDVGKQADFLLLEGASPAILAYHAGVSPVAAVYKKGDRVA